MVSQFHYWSEDEIACNFRRMLTLEQYRNSEMADLYQKVLASGPVCFIEDLFREMMQSGILREGNTRKMSVEFYAPFYRLLSMTDAVSEIEEKERIFNFFTLHIQNFFEKLPLVLSKVQTRNIYFS